MILKNNYPASEQTIDIVRPSFRSYLLQRKMSALSNGSIIPDDLIANIEDFKDRNAILEEKGEKICCQQCLKAHAFVKAKEFGLPENAISKIDKMIEGKIGHDGYYLDEGELIRVD